MEGAAFFLANFGDNLHDFRVVLVEDDVGAGLDDTGLGARDFGECVAEILGVLEADVGDHGDFWGIDHIGGVKFAAETYFENHKVAPLTVEVLHADRRNELELARMILHGLRLGAHALGDFAQSFLRDILAAHLDALPEILDIRGREKACPIARLAQNALDHGAGRAFAVGAGHVDEAQVFLRVAEPVQKFLRARKAQAPLAPGVSVDVIDCFLRGHEGSFFVSVSGEVW